MIQDIKKQIYDILTKDLKYNVMDNPYDKKATRTFPYCILNLQELTRDMFKTGYHYNFRYTIDIFSDYEGEAEILEMEQAIFEALQKLYDNNYVTYLRESGFRIMDDKSTGVVRKHGIITYSILCLGGIEVVNESEAST